MSGDLRKDQLKSQITFSDDIASQKAEANLVGKPLTSPVDFDNHAFIESKSDKLDPQVDVSVTEAVSLKTRKASLSWGKLGFGLAGVTILAQFFYFVYSTWSSNPVIAIGWSVAAFCLLLACLNVFIHEIRCLVRLKKQAHATQQLAQANVSHSDALECCEQLGESLPHKHQLSVWRNAVTTDLTGVEVFSLFDQIVMREVDSHALRLISQHAAATGAIVSFSPVALIDALVVFWRQLRMLYQVVEIYGYGSGYWVRIQLIKRIFKQSLIAGASEIVSELGSYALGANVLASVSSKVAQGVGIGTLTARLGIKMMHVCRPIPFNKVSQPKLEEVSVSVIETLKNLIKGSDGR